MRRFEVSTDSTLREVEDKYIAHVLWLCDGSRTLAAKRLGLSERGLRNRLNTEPLRTQFPRRRALAREEFKGLAW